MREEGIATQNVFPSETSRAKALKTVEERIVEKSWDIIVKGLCPEVTLGTVWSAMVFLEIFDGDSVES